jgi:hypothetical protein
MFMAASFWNPSLRVEYLVTMGFFSEFLFLFSSNFMSNFSGERKKLSWKLFYQADWRELRLFHVSKLHQVIVLRAKFFIFENFYTFTVDFLHCLNTTYTIPPPPKNVDIFSPSRNLYVPLSGSTHCSPLPPPLFFRFDLLPAPSHFVCFTRLIACLSDHSPHPHYAAIPSSSAIYRRLASDIFLLPSLSVQNLTCVLLARMTASPPPPPEVTGLHGWSKFSEAYLNLPIHGKRANIVPVIFTTCSVFLPCPDNST